MEKFKKRSYEAPKSSIGRFIGVRQEKEFSGQKYILHNGYKYKKDAEIEVNNLRSIGWRAKLCKCRNKAFPYLVYYRPIARWKKTMRVARRR